MADWRPEGWCAGDHPPRGREELAREDHHDPAAGFRCGAPARSALTPRLIMAVFGAVVCGLGTAAFVIITYQPLIAGFCACLAAVAVADIAVVAVADIAVVACRKLRGEPG